MKALCWFWLVCACAVAQHALPLSGDVDGTHDPALAEDKGRYYVFSTGAVRGGFARQLGVRCSSDLMQWARCGAVFAEVPPWITALSPSTKDLWAPDVSYFDGLFHLYYAFSVFGRNTSGIGLATSPTLDPGTAHWTDRGLVLRSVASDDFNAIDPNVVLDGKGQPWLAFGSFWSGIKMRRLDRATGLLSAADTRLYALASRAPGSTAIEAPYVFHHGDFYYLFVAWDLCCRGKDSTYRTMVGRSRSMTGPYVDRDGRAMLGGGGTAVLSASDTWRGPGGASVVATSQGDMIAFHAYRAETGRPALRLSTLAWVDGWPVAALP